MTMAPWIILAMLGSINFITIAPTRMPASGTWPTLPFDGPRSARAHLRAGGWPDEPVHARQLVAQLPNTSRSLIANPGAWLSNPP